MAPARALVSRILLVNLNTRDLVAACRFYVDVFGFELRAEALSDAADYSFQGIEGPVSNRCWFLYDSRGTRGATALQLIGWERPATAGDAYPHLVHRGLTSLLVRAADPAGLIGELVEAGGSVADGWLVRDPDGVHLELVAAPSAAQPELAGVRIGCADLDASLEWYAVLGLVPLSPPADRTLSVDGSGISLRSAPVALPAGGLVLELTQWLRPEAVEPPRPRLHDRGLARLAFSVDDLAAARKALAEAGSPCPEPILAPLQGSPGVTVPIAYTQDPDGLPVELVQRAPRASG